LQQINSDCAVIKLSEVEFLPEARDLQVNEDERKEKNPIAVNKCEGEDRYGS
jgi:hypothetical protein